MKNRAISFAMTWLTDREGNRLVRRVRAQRLTYLSATELFDLRKRAQEMDRSGVEGVFLEAGCALGGSAIVLAASKNQSRELYVYDVFGMIPAPGDHDGADVKERYAEIAAGRSAGIAGDRYYGYEDDLLERVTTTFERFGLPVGQYKVNLVQGLFQDTLSPAWSVALAHIDGDWYDSVTVCLERIWPVLTPGGVIVIDDYYDWSGCRQAVDDFLLTVNDCRREEHARLHLVKTT